MFLAEKTAFLSPFLVLTYEGSAFYIFMYTFSLDLSGCFSWKSCNWIIFFLSAFLVFSFDFDIRPVCSIKRVWC